MDAVIPCSECKYVTKTKANLYKHQQCHREVKMHKCAVCMYECRTSSNMKRHEMTHINKREFECPDCGKKFQQKVHLQIHFKRRHENRRYLCSICGKGFSTKHSVKTHMKEIHIVELGEMFEIVTTHGKQQKVYYSQKPAVFECRDCGASFDERQSFQQHVKRHSPGPGVKFYCTKCSYISQSASNLERHMGTHTGLKPFVCGYCKYRSNQKEHVTRHIRTKHKDKLETCFDIGGSTNELVPTETITPTPHQYINNGKKHNLVSTPKNIHLTSPVNLDTHEVNSMNKYTYTQSSLLTENAHFPTVFEDLGIAEVMEISINDIGIAGLVSVSENGHIDNQVELRDAVTNLKATDDWTMEDNWVPEVEIPSNVITAPQTPVVKRQKPSSVLASNIVAESV